MTVETGPTAARATEPGLRDSFRSMGTDVTVALPEGRQDVAVLAREVIRAWDRRFSRFDAASELSRLNATAGTADGFVASDDLFAATAMALDAAAATDGVFDPLLGARLGALGYDRTFSRLVERGARVSVEPWLPGRWREVITDASASRIWLPAGTALDLGGIAKGMAVDAAIEAVVRAGADWATVNAGGDLAVYGIPPGADSWPIAVDGLGERVLAIRDGALATSTVLERRWLAADGTWRHHLIDPRTGLPADSDVLLASVSAATCTQAEVAAKVALILGRSAGMAFLDEHGLSGLLVGQDGSEWWVRA